MKAICYDDETAPERLAQLGLDAEMLRRAVEEGQLARDTCTPNDPPLMPGVMSWGRMNRALREQLMPLGWTRKNDRGQPLTLSPDESVAIVAFSGDDATGDRSRSPQPKNPKGIATLSAIRRNTRQLSLFPTLVPDAVESRGPLTWVLLVARKGNELHFELSLPRGLDEKNKVADWAERILMSPIALGDNLVVTPAEEHPLLDVEVVRRAQ